MQISARKALELLENVLQLKLIKLQKIILLSLSRTVAHNGHAAN